jgi:seryl-tRNA synthetase
MLRPPPDRLACKACRHALCSTFSARSSLKTAATASIVQLRSYTRPPNAPKPTLDLSHIRRNPGLYEQNCKDKNYPQLSKHAWKIAELWEEQARVRLEARPLREKSHGFNERLKHIAGSTKTKAKSAGSEQDRLKVKLLGDAKHVKEQLSGLLKREKDLQDEMEALALEMPNLSSQRHVGEEPEVLGHIGTHPQLRSSADASNIAKEHVEAVEASNDPETSQLAAPQANLTHHLDIGSHLGILDLPAAATTSGWGWYYLVGSGALLEQALVQHAISVCLKHGWQLVSPPSIVYGHIANACGFQPRDQNNETQIYELADQPHVLAGTAEIPLAAMKANTMFDANSLPLKAVGVSRSYRAEAGARGTDTRGLYRVHEFTKVEMLGWALPDAHGSSGSQEMGNFDTSGTERRSYSAELFDEMLQLQKSIIEPLGLHCRILGMPPSDLGASAACKIDIEAFFPSRLQAGKDDGWGEITSLSNCTDYQSRRLNTKVKSADGGKSEFVHTVNGTAVAVPRVIAALLENGWDASRGVVRIPACLRPWMGGAEVIERARP